MKTPDYTDRVIAFIDILGFSNLIKEIESDEELHSQLYSALRVIEKVKHSSIKDRTAQTNLEVSVFSDSIVISGEPRFLFDLVWSALHLQCNLLALGILVRGGISKGRTVHEDDILYGEGMLRAHYLESKTAVYPRIVINQDLAKELGSDHKPIFNQDVDGMWFLNPFSIGFRADYSNKYMNDGFNPHEESLNFLAKVIDTKLKQLSDPNHLAKWNWLKYQHNVAIAEISELGEPRFWHHFHNNI